MIGRPDFAYVQARIQSRHGERPGEPLWQRLHGSREVGHLLEAARAGGLDRWLERISAGTGAHAVDRALRRELRDYVAEVATWTPVPWRSAVEHTALLVDLPALERLLGPEPPPAWVAADAVLAPFALDEPAARANAMRDAGLGPMVDAVEEGRPARDGWRRGFEERLPADPGRTDAIRELADAIEAHIAEMRRNASIDGWVLRADLAERLHHVFRWHALHPVAVFAHLALVALDLERLRGAILRRRLFPETSSEVSWV